MQGTTRTFRFHPVRQTVLGISFAVYGAAFVASAAVFASGLRAWAFGAIVLGLFFAWGAICRFRMGAQVSGRTLTIRNELRSYVVDAGDIRAITLQPKQISEIAAHWRPRVVLASGRGIWIDNLDCGPARRPPRLERVAVVDEVRALLGVAESGDGTTGPTSGRSAHLP